MTLTANQAKAQAARLEAALLRRGIKIKHTRAIDLVCASNGLRNRLLLASTAMTPPPVPDFARITEIATTMARHDDARRSTIVSATASATHPAGVTVSVGTNGDRQDLAITFEDMTDPGRVIQGTAMTDVVRRLAAGYAYYQYFDGSNAPIERRCANEIAYRMIDAIEVGEDPLAGVEKYFDYGETATACMDREGTEPIEEVVEDIAEQIATAAPTASFDRDAWQEAIESAVAEKMTADDTSSVTDLLGKNDRAEMVFVLGAAGGIEDDMIVSHKAWSEPAELAVTRSLQFALSRLGYTLTEFRALSGNRHKAYAREKLEHARPPRGKVVEWRHVSEIISEACTSYFNVVLYGDVRLTELAKLRKGQRMTLRNFHLASYNCMSGTFHDSARIPEITVGPEDGYLRSCHGWYTPNGICDLAMSNYSADIEPAAETETPQRDPAAATRPKRRRAEPRSQVIARARTIGKRSKTGIELAMDEALRARFALTSEDGIWGGSVAATEMGYRGRSEDENLMEEILRDLVAEATRST